MRMPTFKGWLEHCFGAVSGPGKSPVSATPVVEVDADLAELIPQYLNNRWADLHFARQLLANRDFALLSRMATRVGSSAASHGFLALGAIAETLRTAAERQDPNGVAAGLNAFESFLRSVRIDYV